jgi:hypothetical protein
MIRKIISGGQTGADRAALDVAIELGIPHDGWIPKGRRTEDGRLPDIYRLKETLSIDYSQRTELNVLDSDGTLIISHGKLTEGSALSVKLAKKHRKPCLHIDVGEICKANATEFKAVEIIGSWIELRGISTLNVAGPRASKDPRIYEAVTRILKGLLYPPPERIVSTLPNTVDEAVRRLNSDLPLKDKTMIARMGENDLPGLFLTLGAYIRDKFGLWSGNEALLDSCRSVSGENNIHEDDASMVIIRELWEELRKSHTIKVVK